jgi:hypothetical protein
MPELPNAQMEQYCQACARGANGSDAVRIAGYRTQQPHQQGRLLEMRQDVRDRLAELRAELGEQRIVEVEDEAPKLVDQTFADLRTLGGAVPARAVHEGTCDGPVRTLVRHTEEAHDGGEVLIATQAAHARMPYFQGADRWDLVLDQIPDATWERNLEVKDYVRETVRAEFSDDQFLWMGNNDIGDGFFGPGAQAVRLSGKNDGRTASITSTTWRYSRRSIPSRPSSSSCAHAASTPRR